MENKINQNIAGLNLDSVNYQIKENMITFALNANIQSHDGNSTTYTNEPSNQLCYNFINLYPGFKIVGVLSIIEQSKLIVFLAHPDGRSLIGQITDLNKNCTSLVESETDCGCISGTVLDSTILSSLIPIAGTGECPAGYTFNSKSGFCEKLISTPIQETVTKKSVISSCRAAEHGTTLTRIYKDTWITQTPPTYHTVVESNLTQSFWFPGGGFSYIKQIGIQADIDNTNNPCGTQETLDFLGFTETICISDTKQYYLGLAADDSLRVSIDGNIVFDFDSLDPAKSFATLTDLWARYNLFPVNISKGSHLLKFEYKNKPTGDPGNRGMFAYELYDISLAQLTDPNLTRVILQNSRVLSNGKPITSEIKASGRILQISYTGTATGTFTISSAVQGSTSGTGTDAEFKIVVNAGVITSLILQYSGKGYKTGDTLIISSGSALNVTVTVVAASVQQDFIELSQACPVGYTLYVNEDCVASCQKIDQKSAIIPTTSVNCCIFTPLVVDNCCDCSDCYEYSVESISKSPYIVNYIDCSGLETNITFPAGGVGVFRARKDKYTLTSDTSIVSERFISQGICVPKSSKCCLGLSPDYPVYAEYRIDNCNTKVYFIAKNITPRFFSLEEPYGKDQCGVLSDCLSDSCERLKLFPDFCQAEIYPTSVNSGGALKGGVYSFSIAYADENGKELTDYVDFCNPIPIFERSITQQTEYVTSKSIRVAIEHSTAIFDYFNLVVADNINEVTTYHMVGTYRVNQTTNKDSLIYTGEYTSTFSSIVPLIRTPHYNSAGIIDKQSDMLMLGDLTETPKYNFQLLANNIKLRWETVEMPADQKFDYSNPEIAYFFRTYQRDEVYPFGIKFRLKNGKYTDVFHIPGRVASATGSDTDTLSKGSSLDVFTVPNDCIIQKDLPTWKVYNTATAGLTPPNNNPSIQEAQYNCKITVKDSGEFSYWESTETYPCYTEVWGALAEKPIRFHKFPENALSHIHADGKDLIYPIGVRILESLFEGDLNTFTVYDPLNTYGNHQIPVKELICGYELVRGNRVNNKSVIAKGLIYDVGTFEDVKSGKKFYYPNYPYNDIRPDAYIKSTPDWYNKADRGIEDSNSAPASGLRIHEGFKTIGSRYTFHSPDTHFQYPKMGTELKLETLEFGKVQGKFVPVLDHPQYKFLTKADYALSAFVANTLAQSYETVKQGDLAVPPAITLADRRKTDGLSTLTNNQILLDIIEKLIPNKNFAYQFNSVGKYTSFRPITTKGNRRRFLDIGLYANNKIVELNDDKPLHNRLRETSVYLKTSASFSYEYPFIQDTSRYTIGEKNLEDNPEGLVESDTRAYYASIKREFPNQYGQIENIRYVSTGYIVDVTLTLNGTAKILKKYYPAFGGDTYINKFALKRKHSFFTRNLANLPAKVNNVPFDYWLFPNLGYPTYYIGESPEELTNAIATSLLTGISTALVTFGISSLAIGGANTSGTVFNSAVTGLLATVYSSFVKKNNLDAAPIITTTLPLLGTIDSPKTFFYQKGFFYTASYGIPVFYVESDINVDLRHGRNDLEENFYPNVGDGIPDDWLHEVNVPIKYDNFYHYNATYSAQNLSPNFPYRLKYPSLECLTYHYNRVIYSDPANASNYLSDAWRVFRAGNFYDFPKQGGRLIDLNGGENERIYARFENTTKVYNSRITLDNTSPYQLEIGNADMFKQKPVDLSKTDLGYTGTQHKAYVTCEYGTFWVDAKRGHIYQITGQGFNEIKTDNNFNWFKNNLPFNILKNFPDADIDNPQAGLGIVMGWDERYERVFITKLDYLVRKDLTGIITYENRKYYYQEINLNVEVKLTNPTYFENKSWTVAYSPKLKNFISFYSFLPNFFVPLLGHFQTIINTNAGATTWNHNLSIFTYQTYYGTLYPYILEYNANSFPQISTVNSVTLMQDIQEYYSDYEYYSLSTANKNNLANFTKAIIYNKEQSSGIIKLIPEEFGNTRQKITYPRMTTTGIEALISRREHLYTFNGFWNVAAQGNGQPLWSTQWGDLVTQYPIDKVPNTKSVRPTSVSYQKNKIKSDFARVRLIQDAYSRFKFINTIQITQTNP